MWLAAVVVSQAALWRARRRGLAAELEQRRRSSRVMALEHAALALAIACGLSLMSLHGWRLGYPRWLSLKLGLVAFLLVPLEAMHAWVNHVLMARALRTAPPPGAPVSRELDRWLGMDDMIRTLAALLLGVALPALVWLSIARPA